MNKINSTQKVLLLLIGLLVVCGTFYALAAIRYQNNVNAMIVSLENAKNNFFVPNGATEKSPITVSHGENILKSFCIDTNCPQVESEWKIKSNKNHDELESEIIKSIQPTNPKWNVYAYVFEMDPQHYPSSVSEGEEWFDVKIFINE